MANLKARELDDLFRKNGPEKATIMALTHVIERQNDLEAHLTVMGQLLDKMSDNMVAFMTVAGNMKDVIDSMKPKDA